MRWTLILLMSLALCSIAYAETKSFQMSHGKISMDVPSGWQEAQGLFGIQHTLLGPAKFENRPVITIDSTDFSNFKFDEAALKAKNDEYKVGREKWLQKHSGKSLEYFPYVVKKISDSVIDHGVGFRYEINEKQFVERSHYMLCGKNLYHIKTLLLVAEEETYTSDLEKMIRGFSCQ